MTDLYFRRADAWESSSRGSGTVTQIMSGNGGKDVMVDLVFRYARLRSYIARVGEAQALG